MGQLWAACTVFISFDDISAYIEDESSNLHAYIVSACVILLFYLVAVSGYSPRPTGHTRQLI
jgi:hypothetical protein